MNTSNLDQPKNLKVLLAEDSEDLREAVSEALKDEGYKIEAARNGGEAVELFELFDPDIAILDMHMPVMNGSDVCASIRETSDIPVFMFTSSDDTAEVNYAISKGVTGFVLKTTGIPELLSRIEAHLDFGETELESEDQTLEDDAITTEPASAELQVTDAVPSQFKTKTLIVDPDAHSRFGIKSILTRLYQDFIEVETSDQVLRAIEEHDPDLMIIEHSVVTKELFKKLSELKQNPGVKKLTTIVMAERISPESQRKFASIGVSRMLAKPLDTWKAEVMIGRCITRAARLLSRMNRFAATPVA